MTQNTLTHSDIKAPSPFDIAMMLLSAVAMVLVLCIFVVPMHSETRRLLTLIDTMICTVFILHFVFNLVSSNNKIVYIKEHWLEFIASIPLIEPLRLLRFLQIFRVIRMIRIARSVLLPILKQRIQTTMAGLLVFMVIIVAGSAVAIFIIESNAPNANITTAEDALWWGLITISTVGYGDFYPVTTWGRVISSLLIISGVSLFGVISGYIASSFSKAPEDTEHTPIWAEKMMQEHNTQHQQLLNKVSSLEAEITELKKQQQSQQ
ncbi:ion transport 2 domain-containing protein [Catenovulum agarivorans DS-2]|uniref:Ion transport 2 domain-containing protein n=1 Tax=Catenovulum agarivorans DS-2 TaxID=1328313 RepID=W7QG57_9ALTE|nr:ion transporter [Catenovulum agarivorans]EWH10896.1 ion transport 2 domain-containing protein [Catenovulum agarivorans DS-2]